MSTMVLTSFLREDRIGTSTSTPDSISIKEDLICSSDESSNAKSISSLPFVEQTEERFEAKKPEMFVETISNGAPVSVTPSNHVEIVDTHDTNCIEFLSLSKDDDTDPEDVKVLKNKLHRVLKKKDQYRRRVESLTNGIIALRGTKLILERKIIGAKLSWDIKQNKKLKS